MRRRPWKAKHRGMGAQYRSFAHFLSEQSMRERVGLMLRMSFAVVALGAALAGRMPPAHAQPMPVDQVSLLDYKIKVESDAVADLRAQVALLTTAQVEQGKEQARQDTRISLFFSILSLLSTGGIVLQFRGKRAPP